MAITDRYGVPLRRDRLVLEAPQVDNAHIRAASPHLLHINGAAQMNTGIVQADEPGMRQPLPNTAVDLIAALGATGVIAPASVLAIYQCDTASPLVDSLGLGPNLVAAGGPLTGRECVGLPTATFNSKVGCELINGGNRFEGVGFDANNSVVCHLAVVRYNTNPAASGVVISHLANPVAVGYNAWILGAGPSTYLEGWVGGASIGWALLSPTPFDGSWHSFSFVVDDAAKRLKIHSDLGSVTSGAYVGSVTTPASSFRIGPNNAFHVACPCQVAYLAVLNVEVTDAQRATFWRAYGNAALGTPNTYARLNPLIVPITASRVACYAGGNVGQLAVGYSAGFLTDGNAGQTGICCEDGATFEPCGSSDLPGNATDTGGNTHSTVDGADGMRSGVRAVQTTNAWSVPPTGRNCYVGPIALAGATNVPFLYGCMYRRATVGITARTGMTFVGDPGGREDFNSLVDNASPVDWALSQLVVTPTRAAHTTCYMVFGASAVGDNCDFSHLFLVRNRSTPVLGWRAVGLAVAAAVTSTPVITMVNTGNRRYNPVCGRARIRISGFQATSGAVFLDCAVAGTAGSMQLNYNAGQLIFRIWDSTPALVAALNCGALGTGEYILDALWDARTPIVGNAAGGHMIVKQGATILGEGGAAWTPPTADVTPIAVGVAVGGAGAARCLVSVSEWYSLPGSVYD